MNNKQFNKGFEDQKRGVGRASGRGRGSKDPQVNPILPKTFVATKTTTKTVDGKKTDEKSTLAAVTASASGNNIKVNEMPKDIHLTFIPNKALENRQNLINWNQVDPYYTSTRDADQIEGLISRLNPPEYDYFVGYDQPIATTSEDNTRPVIWKFVKGDRKLRALFSEEITCIRMLVEKVQSLLSVSDEYGLESEQATELFDKFKESAVNICKGLGIAPIVNEDTTLVDFVEYAKSPPNVKLMTSPSTKTMWTPEKFDPKIGAMYDQEVPFSLEDIRAYGEFMATLDAGEASTSNVADKVDQPVVTLDDIEAKKKLEMEELNALIEKVVVDENNANRYATLKKTFSDKKFKNLRAKEVPKVASQEIIDKLIDAVYDRYGKEMLKDVISVLDPPSRDVPAGTLYDFDYLLSYVTLIVDTLTPKGKGLPAKLRPAIRQLTYIKTDLMKMRSTFNELGIVQWANVEEMYAFLSEIGKMWAEVEVLEKKLKKPLDKSVANLTSKTKEKKSMSESAAFAPHNRTDESPGGIIKSKGSSSTGRRSSGYGTMGHSLSSGLSRSTYGDHSISGEASVHLTNAIPPIDVHQNIVTESINFVTGDAEHILYGDGGWNMHSTLNGPTEIRQQAKSATKSAKFERFYPKNKPLQIFNVEWSKAVVADEMDQSLLDPLTNNSDKVDAKRLTGVLQGTFKTNRAVAETFAESMTMYRHRYNNESLYMIAAMLEMALSDMEIEDIRPVLGPAPEGAINYFNFHTFDEDVRLDASNYMRQHVGRGSININAKKISQKDLRIMGLISSGLSSVTTPNDCPNSHIISHFRMNPNMITWTVYDNEEIAQANPNVQISAADVTAFIHKMVYLFNDYDAMVIGYCKASAYINGKIVELGDEDAPVNRFIPSTLEMGEISITRPQGYNPLWDVLEITPKMPAIEVFRDDFEALIGRTAVIKNNASVIVATMLSLGVSTTFHMHNLTGHDLNASRCSPLNDNNCSTFVRDLVQQRNFGNAIMATASGYAAQVSNLTIHPNLWRGSGYNASMLTMNSRPYTDNDWWEGVWGTYIPYLHDPLASAFLHQRWPDLYGILSPKVEFDVTEEVHLRGPPENQRWCGYMGDRAYGEILRGGEPWEYNAYALLVINAMRQAFSVEDYWAIPVELYDLYGQEGKFSGVYEDMEVEFDEDFGHIKIGTLPTWSWSQQKMLVPCLTSEIGREVFNAVTISGVRGMNAAGIYLPRPQTGPATSAGIAQITTIKGLDAWLAASSGGRSGTAASEN